MSDSTQKINAFALYRLRNGILVNPLTERLCQVLIRYVPPDANAAGWHVGEESILVAENQEFNNPLAWRGGAHGEEFDIVEKVDSEYLKKNNITFKTWSSDSM